MIENFKSLFSLEQIAAILGLSGESKYGNMLRESRKIRLFYGNLSKRYLQKIFQKSYYSPSRKSEILFSTLESRLDVVLYRAGFFESIASAKQLIRNGGIKVNEKKVISPGYMVLPGDIMCVIQKPNKLKNESLQKKQLFWRFQGSPSLLSLISNDTKINCFQGTSNLNQNNVVYKRENLKEIQLTEKQINSFSEKSNISRNEKPIIKKRSYTNQIDFIKNNFLRSYSSPLFKTNFDLSLSNTSTNLDNNKGITSFGEKFVTRDALADKIRIWLSALTKKKLLKNKFVHTLHKNKFDIVNNFIFSGYLLSLKKQLVSLRKKSFFFKQKNQFVFKDQSFLETRKTKPLHLEISYRSRCVIFLFPPQRVYFPAFINFSEIYK